MRQLQTLIVLKKWLFTQQILQWDLNQETVILFSVNFRLITDYSKVSNTVNETVYKSEVCEHFLLTMAKVFNQMKISLTKVCHTMVCGILYSSQNLSASLEIVSWKLHRAHFFLCILVLLCTWIIHYNFFTSFTWFLLKTNCCPCMQTKWNYQWVQFILNEFPPFTSLCGLCACGTSQRV